MKDWTFWKWLGLVIIILVIGGVLFRLFVLPKMVKTVVENADKLNSSDNG